MRHLQNDQVNYTVSIVELICLFNCIFTYFDVINLQIMCWMSSKIISPLNMFLCNSVSNHQYKNIVMLFYTID